MSTLKLIYLFIVLSITSFALSQDGNNNKLKTNQLIISAQVYPAGIIPTVKLEVPNSEKSSFVYGIGLNITDRQDFSDENDNEEGIGFGGTFGYRRYFTRSKGEYMVAFNTDVWNLWIDWQDNLQTTDPTSGETYVLVLQPWIEAGYFFYLNNKKSKLGITGGFGREINIITNGDEVGQGFIASLSLQYVFGV